MEEQDAPPRTAAHKKPKQPFLKRGEGVQRRVEAYKYRKPLDVKAGNGREQILPDQFEQQHGAPGGKAAGRRLRDSPERQQQADDSRQTLGSGEEQDESPAQHINGLDRDVQGETAACRTHPAQHASLRALEYLSVSLSVSLYVCLFGLAGPLVLHDVVC